MAMLIFRWKPMWIRNISNVKHGYANIVIFDMIYVSIMITVFKLHIYFI